MQITNTLMTLALLAVGINAAPLNINMGAYSPALVVGDGALTFGGGEEAAAGGGAQRELLRREDTEDKKVEKRQNAGFDRALTFAEAALTKGPDIELGTGEGGAGVGIKVNNNPSAAAGGEAGRGAGGAAGREA
ncbi:hypothetical protein LX32DRAFT_660494 [Colletotrichum zoysiae]|uniref:Uncharacterized protein n=1 Tax=Colletotrichum zoysiae TaxID=1216348 RepID=A0AAD9M4Y8_9PEZI|nr:hypothetical protein LX32DRAFT_660494 [Colletotrichum zoysiae]